MELALELIKEKECLSGMYFVTSDCLLSSPNKGTCSRRSPAGLPRDAERKTMINTIKEIYEMAEGLGVGTRTVTYAIHLFHFFAKKERIDRFPKHLPPAACVFLACKMDTPRKIATVVDLVQQKRATPSPTMKDDILEIEHLLCFHLNFNL